MSSGTRRTTVRSIGGFLLPRAAAFVALWAASALASASVTYTATDLADTVPGQNLWRYTYTVSAPLPPLYSVNLLFSPLLYADLAVFGSTTGLSPLVLPPDAFLPADGQLTLTATSGIPVGANETVELDFTWLGLGVPGSQSYEVLDDGFNVVGTSPQQTQLAGSVPVSEPTSLGLLALAVGLLPHLRRRHSVTRHTE